MRKVLLVVALCGAFAMAGSQAYASCGNQVPFGHLFDSWFVCPDTEPVAAFAWQTDTTATTFNSAAVRVACEATDNTVDPPCNGTGAGVVGDNQITITGDFSNPNQAGCPVDAAGNHRIAVAVVARDGSGLVVSVSGAAGYLMELAEQSGPLACGTKAGTPVINGTVSKTSTTATVSLTFPKPQVFSDCSPGSVGSDPAVGSCTDSFSPTVTLGNVWSSIQACSRTDRPVLGFTDLSTTPATTVWTNTNVPIDAAGNATVTLNLPTDQTKCLYVGAAMSISGQQAPGITGFTRIAGVLAAAPIAQDVVARRVGGKLVVSWRTSSELNLSGFRVLATNVKGEFQLGGMVAATGVSGSGSSYSQTYSLGDLKGAKSITVESVLSDGSRLRSAKVSISN